MTFPPAASCVGCTRIGQAEREREREREREEGEKEREGRETETTGYEPFERERGVVDVRHSHLLHPISGVTITRYAYIEIV